MVATAQAVVLAPQRACSPPGYSCATAPDFAPADEAASGTGFAIAARSIRETGT